MTSYKVCVVGAGLIGSRIIGELSRKGVKVKVYDSDTVKLHAVPQILQNHRLELESVGLYSNSALGAITLVENMIEAVRDADIVFEAIVDNLEIKQWMFQKITHNCGSHTIICSNTLQLNLDEISAESLFKERILGCRFLYPVYYIPLVETSLSSVTSNEVVEEINKFFNSLDMRVIRKIDNNPRKLTDGEFRRYWDEERRKNGFTQPQVRNSLISKPFVQATRGTACDDVTPIQCTSFTSDVADSIENDARLSAKERDSIPDHVMCSEATIEHSQVLSESIKDVMKPVKSKSLPSSPTKPEDGSDCVICSDCVIDTVILPCAHMWLCYECANTLQNSNKDCPACRTSIQSIVRVFKP